MTFKHSYLSVAILAGTAILTANTALAEDNATIEEVQVTGSYIKGTPGDSALPVQILDRSYIDSIGAVSVSDVIAKLAISSGTENQADSFTAGSTQGTANVNLRGLGLSSTLVLINGRRQTISGGLANDGSVFVDTSSIPVNALERVEVLKEGAASTYGSDAIAGVVNFILRKDFEGFELTTNISSVDRGDQEDKSIGFLWGGGNDTTRNSITGGLLALNENPAEYEKLRSHPEHIPNMVSEIIRWVTPLAHMRRTATRDYEFEGQQIKKGDKIIMWYASGNRDERTIPNPNKFLIDRERARNHISFGFGLHRCMGNRLAEMQLRVLWEEIQKRFKTIEVVGAPERIPSCFVHGISSLPVRLHSY
jgi:hypothetical protein